MTKERRSMSAERRELFPEEVPALSRAFNSEPIVGGSSSASVDKAGCQC